MELSITETVAEPSYFKYTSLLVGLNALSAGSLSTGIVAMTLLVELLLLNAMAGIDIAFYLIHSVEGKEWKKFAERDRIAAQNFAKAASERKAKRIIYLGGLSNDDASR